MTGTVDPTKEAFAAFRADERPGPIHMLNLIKLRPRAAYPDGRELVPNFLHADLAKRGGSPVPRGKIKQGPGGMIRTERAGRAIDGRRFSGCIVGDGVGQDHGVRLCVGEAE